MTILTKVDTEKRFAAHFHAMVMYRQNDQETMEQLRETEEYQMAQDELREVLAGFETIGKDAVDLYDTLIGVQGQIHDMELSFFYRMGFQDGITILSPEFRTLALDNEIPIHA